MITLSEEQAARLLIGRPVEVSVGEPWDFASEDGEGFLRGRIAEVRPGEQAVRLDVTPFVIEGGHRVDHLLATARYVDEVSILEHLVRGESAEANLSYRNQVPEDERDPRSAQKLIGGFWLSSR